MLFVSRRGPLPKTAGLRQGLGERATWIIVPCIAAFNATIQACRVGHRGQVLGLPAASASASSVPQCTLTSSLFPPLPPPPRRRWWYMAGSGCRELCVCSPCGRRCVGRVWLCEDVGACKKEGARRRGRKSRSASRSMPPLHIQQAPLVRVTIASLYVVLNAFISIACLCLAWFQVTRVTTQILNLTDLLPLHTHTAQDEDHGPPSRPPALRGHAG